MHIENPNELLSPHFCQWGSVSMATLNAGTRRWHVYVELKSFDHKSAISFIDTVRS